MVSLCCYELLPYNEFFGLVIIIVLEVVDVSVLVLFSGAKATSRSPSLVISTSCAVLLSVFFR